MRKIEVENTQYGVVFSKIYDSMFVQGEKVTFIEESCTFPRLTMRDVFAAEIMSGLISKVNQNPHTPESFIKISERAYEIADTMIKVRE